LNKQVKELSAQINTLASEGTSLNDTIKRVNREIESANKQLREKDEKITVLSKENGDYKDRNASLSKQLVKVEDEQRSKTTELNDRLRSMTTDRDDTISRLRVATDKIAFLEKDIKRYEETCKTLETKYETRDKDFRTADLERQKTATELKDANGKIATLQKDKNDLSDSLKQAQSKIAKMEVDFGKNADELRQAQKMFKDFESQSSTAVNSLQLQITALKTQIDELSVSFKKASDERDRLKEDKAKIEVNLTVVSKEKASLKEENEQLLKETSILQSKMKTQEYELNQTLKKEREDRQIALNELNKIQETLRSASWQLSELQVKNQVLDKNIASLQNQLKDQSSEMQATIKMERDLKNSYLVQAEDLQKKVNNYMRIEIDLNQKVSSLEKDIAALKVTMDDKIASAMKEKETDYINRLREANDRVKVMEETLIKERSKFYDEIARMATESKQFDKSIEYYEKALMIVPKNPTIYYNMGVVYDEYLDNPSKAIFCYTKYLELVPDAADKEKVGKWIKSCQERMKSR